MAEPIASDEEVNQFLARVPAETAAAPDAMALSPGEPIASDEEALGWLKNTEREEKYGTVGQKLKTGLEGAASAATFGLSTGLETGLGLAKEEDIRARREVNPGSYMLGEGVGLVGGALSGIGAGAAVEAAGAKVAATVLGEAAAAGVARKVGSAAVRGAVENLMVSGGDEVSKMFAGNYTDVNPSDAAGTVASNLGLSALIGGTVSGGIGAINPLWKATVGRKTEAALQELANRTDSAVIHEAGERALKDAVDTGAEFTPLGTAGMAAESENMLASKVAAAVPEPEVNAAFNRLGLEDVPNEAFSDQKSIRDLGYDMTKSPTVMGQMREKRYNKVWEKINDTAENLFKGRSEDSRFVAGKQIREDLVSTLDKEYKPLKEGYEALRSDMQLMEVSDKLKQKAAASLLADEALAIAPESDAAKLAQRISKEFGNLKNVDQLKSYRTQISDELSSALRQGDVQKQKILFAAKDELTALRSAAIEDATRKTGMGRGAKEVSTQTIQSLKDLDSRYSAYKTKVQALGREGGLGNVGSTSQLAKRFAKMSDEQIATRFFDAKDFNQLKFMKDTFPKEFQKARKFKLAEIYRKAIDKRQGEREAFSVGKMLSQLKEDSIGPEAQQMLFGDAKSIVDDLQIAYSHMPGNPNPSGTAYTLGRVSVGDLPHIAYKNATDLVKHAILENLPRVQKTVGAADAKATQMGLLKYLSSNSPVNGPAFKAMTDYMAQTIRAENTLGKATSAIFKSGREVLPQAWSDDKELEKLDKRLKALQLDPTPMFETSGDVGYYLPDHAAAISETAMGAVNYLNTLRPNPAKISPLDATPQVSPTEKQEWKNALMLAENPLTILNKLKSGSITPTDVNHLKNLYPAVYKRLNQKLISGLMDTVAKGGVIPYRTRMGLSLFTGQPLDSTLTPASIQAAQTTGVVQQQQLLQEGQPQARQKRDMGKLDKLAPSYLTPQQSRQVSRAKV